MVAVSLKKKYFFFFFLFSFFSFSISFLTSLSLSPPPSLFLSSFFKKHQKVYYERLADYGNEDSKITEWVDFFLDGVIEISNEAINIVEEITILREADMLKILLLEEKRLDIDIEGPFVMMVVGVNGAGKTTTVGKLAHQYKSYGKEVIIAAGDTFRAAAIEQLEVWGDRGNVPVIKHHDGADPGSVAYDAMIAAKAKGSDILIIDTAGRLHTQTNLMEELKKIKKVISKVNPEAPHEVLLVLDASTGQNAISQAKIFNEAVGVTGLAITKLDGTPKGGIVIGIADELKIPIRFIGVGEGRNDLKDFSAIEFIDAIF